MKKRLSAFVLACLLLALTGATAFAQVGDIQPNAAAMISGGLEAMGNNRYALWGNIAGYSQDYLTIRAVLRNSSGTYITETSNSGYGPTVTATKTVLLAAGTYYVYLYGTSPTHSPSMVVTVNI